MPEETKSSARHSLHTGAARFSQMDVFSGFGGPVNADLVLFPTNQVEVQLLTIGH